MRRGLVLIALLLTACSREPPPDPMVVAKVQLFKQGRQTFEQKFRAWRDGLPEGERDFRGRTVREDLQHWTGTPQSDQAIDDLVRQASHSRYPADADVILKRATDLMSQDSQRAKEILNYWEAHLPAPFWRRYWKAFFESNGAAVATPDPMLLGIEKRMQAALDKGDFVTAARESDELVPVYAAARDRHLQELMKSRRDAAVFQARKTACVAAAAAGGSSQPARIVRGGSIDDFYPKTAIDRGEDGSVVLRARVDRTGCAKAVAVLVHSGVPSIDDAALAWFETAQFSPATENGLPIDSGLIWKVRFVLKD